MPTDPLPAWVLDRRRAIGDNIRATREAKKLTQEQLGELTGIDRKTINRIEQAAYPTDIDRLIRIAAALDVPLADLMK